MNRRLSGYEPDLLPLKYPAAKAATVGLEPTTYRLTAGGSAIELSGHKKYAGEDLYLTYPYGHMFCFYRSLSVHNSSQRLRLSMSCLPVPPPHNYMSFHIVRRCVPVAWLQPTTTATVFPERFRERSIRAFISEGYDWMSKRSTDLELAQDKRFERLGHYSRLFSRQLG